MDISTTIGETFQGYAWEFEADTVGVYCIPKASPSNTSNKKTFLPWSSIKKITYHDNEDFMVPNQRNVDEVWSLLHEMIRTKYEPNGQNRS